MFGLVSYIASSPRRILAVLVISAAAIAATQFAPMLQRSTTPQNAGAEQTDQETVDSARVAHLFYSRPIPVREPGTSVLPEGPGPGQPGEPPGEVEDAVAEIAVSVPSDTGDGTGAVEELVLRPTSAWINVFSESSTLNGEPVQPGDIITAFDPDGALVGRTVVAVEGRYGLMALYMDDPLTQADEGAEHGDLISFEINGSTAVAFGPHPPVWTDNGAVLNINLVAVHTAS
jgi:hypothetical protein